MRGQLLFVGVVLGHLGCMVGVTGQDADEQVSRDKCIQERIGEMRPCVARDATTLSACKHYEGSIRVGRVLWLGMRTLAPDRDAFWLAVRSPEGTSEYAILLVDDACESVQVRSVPDLTPLIPNAVWRLPAEALIDLSKALVGVAQMDRAIGRVLAHATDGQARTDDLSTFGCEMVEEFAPTELGRTGRDGELRLMLSQLPDVETTASSAKVRLLCRFDDLGGSIQQVTTHFETAGRVEVQFRKTGLKLMNGQVLTDDDFFRQR